MLEVKVAWEGGMALGEVLAEPQELREAPALSAALTEAETESQELLELLDTAGEALLVEEAQLLPEGLRERDMQALALALPLELPDLDTLELPLLLGLPVALRVPVALACPERLP